MRYRILRTDYSNAIKSIPFRFTLRGYGFTDLSAILPWRLSRECGGRSEEVSLSRVSGAERITPYGYTQRRPHSAPLCTPNRSDAPRASSTPPAVLERQSSRPERPPRLVEISAIEISAVEISAVEHLPRRARDEAVQLVKREQLVSIAVELRVDLLA